MEMGPSDPNSRVRRAPGDVSGELVDAAFDADPLCRSRQGAAETAALRRT